MKVLHVIGQFGVGGDTTAVLNVLKFVKENGMDYSFDFLTHTGARIEKVEEIRRNGSKVFLLKGDVKRIGILNYYREVKKILKNNKYDIIHFHTSFQSCVGMFAARRCGVRKIVCHSHTSSIQRKVNPIFKFLAVPVCRFFINMLSTQKIACSMEAKRNLFGEKSDCNIIYNGIDIDNIRRTDDEKIKKIKEKYHLNNKKVVGQVGRISEMKNPLFTLELAKRFENDDFIFMLLGEGSQMELVKDKIKNENINNVILTGNVDDVNNYMRIFDYLLLPSKYGEGLPVVLIEQQLVNNNCLCLSADNVTKEANLGNVIYLSIKNLNDWEETLKNIKNCKNISRNNEKKFDIRETSISWLNTYN